jgi:hypothetical protein
MGGRFGKHHDGEGTEIVQRLVVQAAGRTGERNLEMVATRVEVEVRNGALDHGGADALANGEIVVVGAEMEDRALELVEDLEGERGLGQRDRIMDFEARLPRLAAVVGVAGLGALDFRARDVGMIGMGRRGVDLVVLRVILGEVEIEGFLRRAGILDAALAQENDAVGQRGDGGHVVADEKDRAALALGDVLHFAEALFLELGIAHGEHLINDEDLRLQVRGDGEGEADVHAAGVMLDRRVEEHLGFRKGDDLVELAVDLLAGHAEDGAVEVDILAAGKLGMEAGADLEKAGDAALDIDASGGGLGDAAEDLQEGRFARAVATDDADDFARRDVEGDILECPEILRGGGGLAALFPAQGAKGAGEFFLKNVPQTVVMRVLVVERVTLSETGGFNGEFRHARRILSEIRWLAKESGAQKVSPRGAIAITCRHASLRIQTA